MNKKQLIENFQLEGVTEESSDTAVMEALKKKMGGNATPQASGTSNKVQAETVIATVEKITGKPFEAAQRKTLLTIGESSGLEVLAETIAMMSPGAKAEKPGDESEEGKTPAAPRIVSMTEDGSVSMDADRKKWDWDKWQKEDPDALSQMEDKNFKQFSDLYFAKYKKRPQQ